MREIMRKHVCAVADLEGVQGIRSTPLWIHIISFSWGFSRNLLEIGQTNSPFLHLNPALHKSWICPCCVLDQVKYKLVSISYCLNTSFQKLHFSKSHFSVTPQEKYNYVIFLQPKSLKKCQNIFENWFTSKIIMPKNYLE